ncbi:MAG TPA: ABC transporter permease [Gemmatimonadales bacterium]|nr:ABC transporter permease [Gemmatimonadales bacterium]
MSRIQGLRARLRSLLSRRGTEQRLDSEFQFHLDMETEQNIARGLGPDEARRQAILAFGGIQQHREEYRDGRGLRVLRELLRDARHSLRSLRREPSFAVAVVITLALAIGATTAVFTLMRRSVLEPLPYPSPGRLVSLGTRYGAWGLDHGSLSEPEVADLAGMRQTFAGVGAYRPGPQDLAGEDGQQAERLNGLQASASLLPVLGVVPVLGRLFRSDEDLPGSPPVVLLSYGLWQRLGGDSALVGRSIRLNAVLHTVLGVLPPSFALEKADIVVPLRLDPADPGSRGAHYLRAVGRLAGGVSPAAARSAIEAVSARLRADYAANYPADLQWSLTGRSLGAAVLGDTRKVLGLLSGAVVLVLLIACANVANLMQARLQRREREIALRTALGASRGRLVQQLLTEGLVLALIGTGLGLVLAVAGGNLLLSFAPGAVPRVERLGVDLGMLATAVAVAAGSVLLFALFPAIRGTRMGGGGPRVWGARGASAEGWGPGGRGLMGTLVAVEVGLAMLVVMAAGLLVQSYTRLARVDLGFSDANAVAFNVSVPEAAYETPADVSRFYGRLLAALEQLPGVTRAGGALNLPLRSGTGSIDIEVDGRPIEPGRSAASPNFQVVTPGYFEAMRIPVLQGRPPLASDDSRAPIAAWVNRSAAERLWPGQSALGKRFRFPGDTARPWFTVVGVVGDVRTVAATEEPKWEYYLAHAQLPLVLNVSSFHRRLSIVVSTTADPGALAQPIRRVLTELDSRIAPAQLEPMTTVTSRAIARPRLVAILLGAFALLSGTLAMVGIYGVLSYAVTRRTREIGIRLALGARQEQVVRQIAVEGLRAAGWGIVIGGAGALATSRLVEAQLFGIGPRDPAVFGASVLGLAVVSLTAALIPARRAARVQPALTLRED